MVFYPFNMGEEAPLGEILLQGKGRSREEWGAMAAALTLTMSPVS